MRLNKKSLVAAVACGDYAAADAVAASVGRAIDLAGGLEDLRGARVLVKPNLLSAQAPDKAVTTHPAVARGVIHYLRRVGAAEIALGDSPAGDIAWRDLWEATGYAALAAEEGVELLPFESARPVAVPGFGEVPLLADLQRFDAVVSVPKLKTHMLTKITAAVKNVYGLMPGGVKSDFHGRHPSPRRMAKFLAAFHAVARPRMSVLDAVVGMEGNGPASGSPRPIGVVMAADDAVALDAAACAVFGYRAKDIPILVEAARLGLGNIDEHLIERRGDGWAAIGAVRGRRSLADLVHYLPEPIFGLGSRLLRCRPIVDHDECVACGLCAKACPRAAMEVRRGKYQVVSKRCILCMCCVEACPRRAITVESPLGALRRKISG